MLGQYSYLFLLLPLVLVDLYILIRYLTLLKRFKKTLVATILFFSIPWYFIVDPLAVSILKIWGYGSDKILNIWIAGTVIEEWIWMFFVAFLFSSLTLISAKKNGM